MHCYYNRGETPGTTQLITERCFRRRRIHCLVFEEEEAVIAALHLLVWSRGLSERMFSAT